MAEEPIELEAIATAFRRTIYNAWCNTLIGNSPDVVRTTNDRMKAPKVGDWVAEISTTHGFRDKSMTDLDAVGVLLAIEIEPVDFSSDPEFVWDEAVEGKPHPTERVYYIRTLDGRRFRWTNATVVAAPFELRR